MARALRSLRVVKDHAESVTVPAAHATHTVSQVNAIHTARTLHGPMVNREHHSVPAVKRNDLGS